MALECFLREDKLTIDLDLENPTLRGDQENAGQVSPILAEQFFRQPGGPGVVVSLPAEGDGNGGLHVGSPHRDTRNVL